MEKGAVYIVTQDPRYIDLLMVSAASLRRAMPQLPITVFSQFPVHSSLFDQVITVQAGQNGFFDKAAFLRKSPYNQTLFLDADTVILGPVTALFSLMERFDCAATHEEYRNTDWSGQYPRRDIPECFPEFNTGVLMMQRSQRMDDALQEWETLYAAHLRAKPDEPIDD